MFNGSAFNSSAYNGSKRSVRVLMASAILSASMSSAAEPLHTHAGVADGVSAAVMSVDGRLAIRAEADALTGCKLTGLSWAKRAGGAVSYPTAYFSADRPCDLSTASLSSQASLLPDETVFRFGGADGIALTSLDVNEVVHRFYSDISPEFTLTVSGVVTRYGASDIRPNAVLEPVATRIHRASSASVAVATSSINGDTYAGGIASLLGSSNLFAEAHVNGIQPGYALLSVSADAQINGDRLAGAFADAEVVARLEGESMPGRGAEVNDALVSSSLSAVWWTFTQETANVLASAHITAIPTQTHASSAEITASADLEAVWSIIVEPRERIIASTTRLEAAPWRIRHARMAADVAGNFEEDGRVAFRGDTQSDVFACLHAQPWRIVFSGADMSAAASVIRSRLSVNITNPAPEHRQMTVPVDDRAMRISYENRTMVVS